MDGSFLEKSALSALRSTEHRGAGTVHLERNMFKRWTSSLSLAKLGTSDMICAVLTTFSGCGALCSQMKHLLLGSNNSKLESQKSGLSYETQLCCYPTALLPGLTCCTDGRPARVTCMVCNLPLGVPPPTAEPRSGSLARLELGVKPDQSGCPSVSLTPCEVHCRNP